MIKNQKGFTVPAIIVLGILILGGAIFYFNRQSHTAPSSDAPQKYVSIQDNSNTSTSQSIYTNVACQEFPGYFVITADEYNGDVGSDILIKQKSTSGQVFPCAYKVNTGDMQFGGNGSAEYFMIIIGHYLLTDSGTAPGLRGLTVYDLNNGKNVFTDRYMGPTSSSTDAFTYWTSAKVPANEQNCSDYNKYTQEYGGGAILITQVTLDLSTMTKSDSTGALRCVYRE